MIDAQGELFGACQHLDTRIVPMTEGPHHAKESCADCGRFIRWIPKPETLEEMARVNAVLTQLCKLELSEWEREFIRSISSTKRLSPRQKQSLDSIAGKYLPVP